MKDPKSETRHCSRTHTENTAESRSWPSFRCGVRQIRDDERPISDRSDSGSQAAPPDGLSVRAENVLRVVAEELIGSAPSKGRRIPYDLLLQKLTYKHLSTARNCGPQTTAEIIGWARARGKVIKPSFHAGKSLSTMWQDAIAKFTTGDISTVELSEALEHSARRKNTRIPVDFQRMLLQVLRSSKE